MKISVGQKIPNATLSYVGSDGVSHIELTDLLESKKVVILLYPVLTQIRVVASTFQDLLKKVLFLERRC